LIGAFWQKEPTETIAPSPRSEEHRTPFSKISENNRLNKYNKWIDTAGNNEFSAQARFQNEFFYVNSKPKFLFNKDDGFFGIGSCFARNIEHSLKERNLNCLTDGIKIPAGYYNQDRDPRAAMNKFNIPSMIDEINRTFGGSKDESARYIEISENAFFDTATSGIDLLSLDKHAEVKAEIARVFRRLADANAVFITLGLVEMWLDNKTGLYLNTSPHPTAMRQEIRAEKASLGTYTNRFVHMRPNFMFLREKMHEFVNLLLVHAPKAKLVVTVSPVPLQTTMTSDDVVASSTLSKCLLRAVAEDARESFDHVDYFPSYEMVMNSRRDATWATDAVHVTDHIVKQITDGFINEWIV
jgi:hypothetical protein